MKKEKGEIMLESMIIVTMTLFILIWLLGIGFMHYQRYLLTVFTNDVAAKIAATYNNPTSDIVMGYVTTEKVTDRDLYRAFVADSLTDVAENKTTDYVKYMLNGTNFLGTVKEVDVDVRFVNDSMFRKHIEVESTCTFQNPFGSVMKMFGMSETIKCAAVARADCTDKIDYLNTVDFVSSFCSLKWTGSGTVKMVNSIIKLFNHKYAKN